MQPSEILSLTVFDDGSEVTHLMFRKEFHSKKETHKVRKQALIEYANWLDLAER
jgi:hypothetical protein